MNSLFFLRRPKKRFFLISAAVIAAGLLTAALLLPITRAAANAKQGKDSRPLAGRKHLQTAAPGHGAKIPSGTLGIYFTSLSGPGNTDPAPGDNRSSRTVTESGQTGFISPATNPMITIGPSGQPAVDTGTGQISSAAPAAASSSASPTVDTVAYNGNLTGINPQILQQGLSSISQPLIQSLWNPPATLSPSPYATDDFSPQLTRILTTLGFGLIFSGTVLRRLARQTALSAGRLASRRNLTLASTDR